MLFLVVLSLFDSVLETCVPLLNVILEKRGWALISSGLRFHWSGFRCSCLVKLHRIWDSKAASKNFIREDRFCMWFIFPKSHNRFFISNVNLTLSSENYFLDEEVVSCFFLSRVCSLVFSSAIQASQWSTCCLLGAAFPSLWSFRMLE